MLRALVKDMRTAVAKSELLAYSDLNARLHAAILRHRFRDQGSADAPFAADAERDNPAADLSQ